MDLVMHPPGAENCRTRQISKGAGQASADLASRSGSRGTGARGHRRTDKSPARSTRLPVLPGAFAGSSPGGCRGGLTATRTLLQLLKRGDGHVMYNGCFKQAEFSALEQWESAKPREILGMTIHHQKGAR